MKEFFILIRFAPPMCSGFAIGAYFFGNHYTALIAVTTAILFTNVRVDMLE